MWLAAQLLIFGLCSVLFLRYLRTLRVPRDRQFHVLIAVVVIPVAVADAVRILSGPHPLVALVANVAGIAAVIAQCVVFRRAWTLVAMDATIVGVSVVLILVDVLYLAGRLSAAATIDFDLVGLTLAAQQLFFALASGRMMPGTAARYRRLVITFFALRAAAWTLLVLGDADVVGAPMGIVRVLVLGACSVHLAFWWLRVDRPARAVPRTERPRLVHAPYAVMGVAVILTLVAAGSQPRRLSAMVLILVGGVAIVALSRGVVTLDELQRTTRRAEQREEYYRTLVTDTTDVVMICDPDGRLRYVSPAAGRVLGLDRDLLGEPLDAVVTADAEEMTKALAAASGVPGHARVSGVVGERSVEASLTQSEGRIIVNLRDVTERQRLLQHLDRMAYLDPLTGLPNRAAAYRELDERRMRGDPTTVLFIDLDRFKPINDAAGHGVGDVVLRQVSERLRATVPPGDLVARIGGDEFIVVSSASMAAVEGSCTAIVAALSSQPYEVNHRRYRLGASLGVAAVASDLSADEVLRRADLAMYSAKRRGSSWSVYDPRLGRAAVAQAEEESEVSGALAELDIEMYAQPVVDVIAAGVVQSEVLLRWRDRSGAIRPPAPLLQFARRTGAIASLTRRTLELAVDALAAQPGAVLAVNTPAPVLAEPPFADQLAELLAERRIDPDRLILEITEESVVDAGKPALQAMRRIREHGINIVIDDFGTGYSALSYLARLPIDGIKFDRSFTNNLVGNTSARSVVRALVALAEELELHVVAEGVESEVQHLVLTDLGVGLRQGFYYARPEPLTGIADLTDLSSWATSMTQRAATPSSTSFNAPAKRSSASPR